MPLVLVVIVYAIAGQWIPGVCAQNRDGTSSEDTLLNVSSLTAIRNGLRYLSGQQNEDGSFGSDRLLAGNTAVCGLAGLAFLSQGSTTRRGPYAENIRRCVAYLELQRQETGLIDNPDFQSSGPMYGHGFATLFLAEVYGMPGTESLKTSLENAVNLIVNSQNDAGGWRYRPNRQEADISVTVCQVMALRAARNAGIFVPKETIDRAVEYIRKCQNADGGFCYRLVGPRQSGFARSAAAVVGLHSAGIYEGEAIQEAIPYLFQSRPGSEDLSSSYFYYGHYYAVQVFWQVGGDSWQRWFPAIRDELVNLQQSGGKWTSRYSTEYSTAMSLIVLQIPNNVVPIFQR